MVQEKMKKLLAQMLYCQLNLVHTTYYRQSSYNDSNTLYRKTDNMCDE